MFKLLKGGQCYAPAYLGKKDILVVYDKILKIDDNIEPGCNFGDVEVVDITDKLVCPGFIDIHVHITGGGGEEGPSSRIPELMLSEVLISGITTLVGVLGVDNITRSVRELYAKAKALELEGITTYIYTGSYSVPTATMTGKVISDVVLIDKVIGAGEIALADYRSSYPSIETLKTLSSEVMIGGLVGGKPGLLHIHFGDGKDGMKQLTSLINETDFPVKMFVPTHLNRNSRLFQEALEYLEKGGNVDLTAGEQNNPGITVGDCAKSILGRFGSLERVTVSSDGNGSMPSPDGNGTVIGSISKLMADIKECIIKHNLDISEILRVVTSNPAKLLGIYPKKGCIESGSDADLLVFDKAGLELQMVMAKGRIMVNNGKSVVTGKFEK